ncbi:hypothetical protein K466DRAFT_463275, partial [Polyporus arcularius HHB13444]
LELSFDLLDRGIHPTFHVDLLHRHEPNDIVLFPHPDSCYFYDVGVEDDHEWLVDK